MPEAEFWAELLTELPNSPYHSPEISAKAAALIDAGWMEELSGKIVIPRVDPSGEVTLEQPVTFEPWGDYWIRRQGETMQFGSQPDPEGPWFDTVEDFTRYLEAPGADAAADAVLTAAEKQVVRPGESLAQEAVKVELSAEEAEILQTTAQEVAKALSMDDVPPEIRDALDTISPEDFERLLKEQLEPLLQEDEAEDAVP
jgi:hypothetical protein